MAELFTSIRSSVAAAGLLAVLTLGGCAGTNVTDSWQCPLAQGNVCTSVSAADPAVPESADPRALATQLPLYRERPAPPAPRECTGLCDPFAWLADLFTATPDDSGTVTEGAGDNSNLAGVAPAGVEVMTPDGKQGGPAVTQPGDPETKPTGVEAAAVAPSESDTDVVEQSVTAAGIPSTPVPALSVPADDDLRTDEVIGRIWIAPFVDENGVYHEASWVRAVFEAAGWRLP